MGFWPFTGGRSTVKSGLFEGFTDWHSHIMPGVDDGVAEMDDALEILAGYDRLGVAHVWLTAHVMEDVPNTTAELRARFAELCAAWRGRVRLHLGAEYMLDNLFERRLAAGDLLPVGPAADHLLVETSCFNPPLDLYGTLERIRSKGYHPLMAHPERYMYMDGEEYRTLRALGVRGQLNLGSLAGMYGSGVRRRALRLLEQGMYHCAGTDLHRKSGLQQMTKIKVTELKKLQ